MIQLKMKALECSQDFSYNLSMGIFRFGQGQLTPQPFVRSASNSNCPDFKVILVTRKNEEDPIENEGARVFTTLLYINFRRTRANNSGVVGCIWPKLKLIQAFMYFLVTCKNEYDRIKNEGARVITRFIPL